MRLKILLIFAIICFHSHGQSVPSLEDYGPAFAIENPDFKTDISNSFKAVFDIGQSFDDPEKANKLLESAARYIRLHRQAGVPDASIQVAVVIHGSAIFDLLNHENYQVSRESKQAFNPNYDLITALTAEGVDVILCGQTAAYREISKEQMHPRIKIALSAMTALVQLQNDGFQPINF